MITSYEYIIHDTKKSDKTDIACIYKTVFFNQKLFYSNILF